MFTPVKVPVPSSSHCYHFQATTFFKKSIPFWTAGSIHALDGMTSHFDMAMSSPLECLNDSADQSIKIQIEVMFSQPAESSPITRYIFVLQDVFEGEKHLIGSKADPPSEDESANKLHRGELQGCRKQFFVGGDQRN